MDNWQWGSDKDGVNSSAAEFIFPMTGGRLGIITDEAQGMAFEVLKPSNGQ